MTISKTTNNALQSIHSKRSIICCSLQIYNSSIYNTGIYITSTKNSQGFPIAMRNDCLLPDKSCWFCWFPEPVPVCTDCSEPLERLRLPLDLFPFEPFPLPVFLLGIVGTDGIWNSDSDAEEQDFKSWIGSLQICSLPALLPPDKIRSFHIHAK